MNKHNLLNDSDVKYFINFLVEKWSSGFDFRMGIKQRGKAPKYIKISSLREAYENYFWEYSIKSDLVLPQSISLKAYSFKESECILDYCKSRLINENKLSTSKESIREASQIILKWGGVYLKGNRHKVEDGNFDLSNMLNNVINEWQEINIQNKDFYAEFNIDFPSNAGFTKIYSLLLNDYIIYDSRVSVALAFLIENCFGDKIPDSLELFIQSSKIVEKEKRKVNSFFKSTDNKSNKHFYSNVKASIILKEVINILNKDNQNVNLRQIEAALFMIGYDVRN